jgi:hypothetical protein
MYLCVLCTASHLVIRKARVVCSADGDDAVDERKLKMIRVKEGRRIEAVHRGAPPTSHVTYIISAAWLIQWKAFLRGGTRPGPIDNTVLFCDPSSAVTTATSQQQSLHNTLRKKLQLSVDYRCLNRREWAALVSMYGGGPCIRRPEHDIYSSPIHDLPIDRRVAAKRTRQFYAGRDIDAAVTRELDGLVSMEEVVDELTNLEAFTELTDPRVERMHMALRTGGDDDDDDADAKKKKNNGDDDDDDDDDDEPQNATERQDNNAD